MKQLLNTLFVTTQGSYLSREGETVLVRVDHETKLRVPIHTLSGIVCFGQVSCSPPLMQLCGERNVAISFLSETGRFWARVHGPVSGNVLLRREQYRRADDEGVSAEIAQAVVTAKIANCRTSLLRALRDHPDNPGAPRIETAVRELARIANSLKEPIPLERIRGLEGESARTYFSVFDHLVVSQKEEFFFRERSRRPPLDNMNALLSFLYTLLVHDVRSALEGVGLDPAVGYLHRDRPGRPSLALDLMEEFRPFFADRLALSLVNRQQIRGKGFKRSETGAVVMDDETRKEVLMAYQKRKQEEIQHPFLNEKCAIGILPHTQALLLARYLRGDLEGYPPFVWR
ncbi:MAG: type I-C CRISPR-associated endonuclease Cas1 [Candidatus Abyssobacteria bacterium SURF_5]|uniref:CRISPR-associated endonuclease Cas1 n=1 Tax=Abyssobacteria bacterium (strain SURF_5) TaxID=2093360 RepID=A0A3A4NM28_ABYX5|nr:MAG: type I-C CRISPR-associated endonuclease Cas1 [Candidatus Abyssubacteria bacterium SURF_5]